MFHYNTSLTENYYDRLSDSSIMHYTIYVYQDDYCLQARRHGGGGAGGNSPGNSPYDFRFNLFSYFFIFYFCLSAQRSVMSMIIMMIISLYPIMIIFGDFFFEAG